jgi:hypothetical protein
MKSKMYIIGQIPNEIDSNCEAKFYKTQMRLLQMGYDVINPIERLTNKNILPQDAKRKNIQDLMFADAAYIMPCTSIGQGIKNLEIKVALDFNLTIILGTIILNDEIKPKPESITRRRRRRNKIN